MTVFDRGDAVASLYMPLAGQVLIGSKKVGLRDWFGFESVNGIRPVAALCLDRCRFVQIPHAEPNLPPPVDDFGLPPVSAGGSANTHTAPAQPRAQLPLSGGDPGAQALGESPAVLSPERAAQARRPLSRRSSRSSNSRRRGSRPGFKHTRQPWYAGPLPRAECERLVCAEVHGAFLVRLSSNLTSFVICVNDDGRPMHFEVKGHEGKFKFHRKIYDELTDVIEYLARKAVKGKSGKMIYLRGAQINNSSSESASASPHPCMLFRFPDPLLPCGSVRACDTARRPTSVCSRLTSVGAHMPVVWAVPSEKNGVLIGLTSPIVPTVPPHVYAAAWFVGGGRRQPVQHGRGQAGRPDADNPQWKWG